MGHSVKHIPHHGGAVLLHAGDEVRCAKVLTLSRIKHWWSDAVPGACLIYALDGHYLPAHAKAVRQFTRDCYDRGEAQITQHRQGDGTMQWRIRRLAHFTRTQPKQVRSVDQEAVFTILYDLAIKCEKMPALRDIADMANVKRGRIRMLMTSLEVDGDIILREKYSARGQVWRVVHMVDENIHSQYWPNDWADQ